MTISLPRPTSPLRRGRTSLTVLALAATIAVGACSGSSATFPVAPTAAPTAAPTEAAAGTPATAVTPAPAAPTPAPTLATSSIVFVPSTFSCADATTPVGITWTLVGVPADTQILYTWDGSLGQGGQTPQALADAGFAQQPDGSWTQAENSTGADLCSNLGLTAGKHTWQVVKATADGNAGAVLAAGSFTVTP